ncbi:MAG: hypothetical protein ACREPB_11550, partial [Arenimonas sp.]
SNVLPDAGKVVASTEPASTSTAVTPVTGNSQTDTRVEPVGVEKPDTSSTADNSPGNDSSYNTTDATPVTTTANNASSVSQGRGRVAERVRDRIQTNNDEQASGGGGHTFAVVTNGDPALMIPAQQMIEDKLSEAGYQSVNSKRADIIVRVKADIIGNQDISFYGQNATLTTAYLTVKPFGRGGRALGNGFREKIDYTPLNAEDKVQQALEEHMNRVVENVGNK